MRTAPAKHLTRRELFVESGLGVGQIALASLFLGASRAVASPGAGLPALRPPHLPRAKRVIWLFMAGAPSQLELFDSKPELARLEGQPVPPSLVENARYAFIRKA